MEQISATVREIDEKRSEITCLVNQDCQQLLKQLEIEEACRLKALQAHEDELERQAVVVESLAEHVEGVLERGSDVDVA